MDKLFTIMLCVYLFISPFSQAQDKNNIPRVPEWAKDAVWYQIFPERFANGDRTNDPTPHDMEGCVYLFISPFSQAQDKNNIPRVPEWAKDAVWYQIFPERFANGDRTNDPTPHGIFCPL